MFEFDDIKTKTRHATSSEQFQNPIEESWKQSQNR